MTSVVDRRTPLQITLGPSGHGGWLKPAANDNGDVWPLIPFPESGYSMSLGDWFVTEEKVSSPADYDLADLAVR